MNELHFPSPLTPARCEQAFFLFFFLRPWFQQLGKFYTLEYKEVDRNGTDS